jgi:hypothetical protein
MIKSSRKFEFSCQSALELHVNARIEATKYATHSQFSFATWYQHQSLNNQYWDFASVTEKVNGTEETHPYYLGLKKNLSLQQQQAAYAELRDSPAYAIACHQACEDVINAGATLAGASAYLGIWETSGLSKDDWVPGDWGYITNTGKRNKNGGTTGENIIYLGNGQWWGHFLSIGSQIGDVTIGDLETLNKYRIKPLEGPNSWEHDVDMFDGVEDNSYRLEDYRKFTRAGVTIKF